ncbi:hypothetical protein K493DRAFT_378489 [Basidiobolus meristosporus CBS 931.73]|uniref:Uncharacterized protein n=1 Tax=Basidiobolus meristosporus CBS 931.73 TaxID=1314790 RepID=A0A1Y1Y1D4_9FUNG|nr:hypothetical protein K493DRAFT_378489 [Basidiobolus meristosporus CBS 931.73]|eukprot:ORX91526.1 hypothetical protein K493DRAFT_378489 [Basidiobolus meristosporus CBS 931.73]
MMEVLHTRKASLPNFKSFRSHNVDYVYQRRSSHSQATTRTEPTPIPAKLRKSSAPTILEDPLDSRVMSVCSDAQSLGPIRNRRGSMNSRNGLDDDAIFVELVNPSDLRYCPYLVFTHHPHNIGDESQDSTSNLNEMGYFPLSIPINPHTHHVIEAYQLNDKRMLLVIENYWTKCTEIYFDSIKNIINLVNLKVPAFTLNAQCHLTTLNQVKSMLALYDIIGNEVQFGHVIYPSAIYSHFSPSYSWYHTPLVLNNLYHPSPSTNMQ